MRSAVYTLLAAVIVSPAIMAGRSTQCPISREKASLSDTQTLSFDPAGVIQLERSFGDVEIEGWDRPEVEITTIRTSHKKYAQQELAAAERDLNRIAITAVKTGEDQLKIMTDFPAHAAASLHGKPDTELKYVIKAPARAKIVVHHDVGQVNVANFLGDIEVTNRVGEIGLRLKDPSAYRVDARARIGDVASDVGCSVGQNVVGQQLVSSNDEDARPQLYLRVGIGDISIRKIKW